MEKRSDCCHSKIPGILDVIILKFLLTVKTNIKSFEYKFGADTPDHAKRKAQKRLDKLKKGGFIIKDLFLREREEK